MAKYFCCPQCGNRDLQAVTESITSTTGSNYSASQGCCGLLLLGPFGLLCGLCGKGQETTTQTTTLWVCNKCGKKFDSPDDIRSRVPNDGNTFVLIMFILGLIIGLLTFLFFLLEGALYDEGLLFVPLFSVGIVAFFTAAGFWGRAIRNTQYKNAQNRANEVELEMAAFFESNIESNNNPTYSIPSHFPIRCTNCNAVLNNNARFCTQCGMHIETTEPPSQNNV